MYNSNDDDNEFLIKISTANFHISEKKKKEAEMKNYKLIVGKMRQLKIAKCSKL